MKLAHNSQQEGAQRRPFRNLLVASAIMGSVILTGGTIVGAVRFFENKEANERNRQMYLPKLENAAYISEGVRLGNLWSDLSAKVRRQGEDSPQESFEALTRQIAWRMEAKQNPAGKTGERKNRITDVLDQFKSDMLSEESCEVPEANRKKDSLFALRVMLKERDGSWMGQSGDFGPYPDLSPVFDIGKAQREMERDRKLEEATGHSHRTPEEVWGRSNDPNPMHRPR